MYIKGERERERGIIMSTGNVNLPSGRQRVPGAQGHRRRHPSGVPLHTCVCVYVCVRIYIYYNMYIYIYIYTHIHIHVRVYIYIYTYISPSAATRLVSVHY